MLENLGYDRQWFSSDRQLHLRLGDKLITIVADSPQEPPIYVGGRKTSAIESAVADLSGIIGDFETEWTEETTLPEARKYMLDAAEEEDDD